MIINYSDKEVMNGKSIFLAGPINNKVESASWRMDATKILGNLGFDGIVYVPELEHDSKLIENTNQFEWEKEAMKNATSIVLWVPSHVRNIPYQVSMEFGYWISKKPSKCLYGRAHRMKKLYYLDWLYEHETYKRPMCSLEDLLKMSKEKVDQIYNPEHIVLEKEFL